VGASPICTFKTVKCGYNFQKIENSQINKKNNPFLDIKTADCKRDTIVEFAGAGESS